MKAYKNNAKFYLSLLMVITLLFQSISPGIIAFAEEIAPAEVEESSEPTDIEVGETTEEFQEDEASTETQENSTEEEEEIPPADPESTEEEDTGTVHTEEETASSPELPVDSTEEISPKEEEINEESEKPAENETLRESSDFVTATTEGGLMITGWTGSGETVVIPDEIDGVAVVSIGKNAFQNLNLKEITLGKNIKIIEAYAFADNVINKLTIPTDSALERIREFAFLDNNLSSFTFPEKLKVIERGAFSDNQLTSLSSNQVVEEIHDYAFSKNNLTEVNLGNSIVTFGVGVFSDNGRYVKLSTENPVIPKLEKNPGPYGHVVGAVRVVLKYIDKATGKELRSPQTVGDDMMSLDNIFVIGEEVSVKPVEISGYVIKEEIFFTPDKDLYVVELFYQPITTPPVIERVLSPEIPVGTEETEVEALLRSFVKATDLLGEDITEKIVIDQGDLDLAVPGSYSIKYSVEDRFGNKTEYLLDVMVGTDWMQYPIGGGWVLGDFTYDGDKLTGLSQQGKAKLNEMIAGQKHLILPPFSPLGDRPSIKSVGISAFSGLILDTVDFVHMKELDRLEYSSFRSSQLKEIRNLSGAKNLTFIGVAAFFSNQLEQIDFSGLDHLKIIDGSAFEGNRLSAVDLSPLKSIESIGDKVFKNNAIKEIHFGELPKIKTLGAELFFGHTAKSLDLSGLTGLETIRYAAFAFSRENSSSYVGALESVNFSNLSSLTFIGKDAFRSNNLLELDLSPLVSLQEIDDDAFRYNMKLQSLTFGDIPLQKIGAGAFSYSKVPVIDLSTLVKLEEIGDGAFARTKNTENVYFPVARGEELPQLRTIGQTAFLDSGLVNLVIKDLPYLESIGGSAFSQSAMLVEARLSNLPMLKSVGTKAFYLTKIKEIFIDNAPLLVDLPVDIVHGAPGHPDYRGLIVIWVTPKETNKIPSKSNYLVNPDAEAQGEWIASDFTYTVTGEISTITGFSESGAGKVMKGIFPVVFPERDDQGNLIESIAPYAFYSNRIQNADLSRMTGLKTIGSRAFHNNGMETLELGGLSNLTTIGEYAFSNNKISSLDFSSMEQLEKIGAYAFLRNDELANINFGYHPKLKVIEREVFLKNSTSTSIAYVDLSGMPNLEVIGYQSFNKAGIEKLNLRGLEKLREIHGSAFQQNKIDGLDFTDLKSLTTISNYAFASGNRLGSLDLSPLVNLKYIATNGFSYAGVTQLNFGELPSLEFIGDRAFSGNKLETLDLSSLTGLTSIGDSSFYGNPLERLTLPMDGSLKTIRSGAFSEGHLSVVEIPLTVTTLYTPFRYNKPNKDGVNKLVILQTPTRNNPNNLANDITANNGGHVVDPNIVTLRYIDEETGEELRPSEIDYATDLQAISKDYFAHDLGGYYFLNSKETVVFEEGTKEYEVVFKYRKKTYDDLPALNIHIDHKNLGSDRKHVGDILTTQVKLDASSAIEDQENVFLVINFDPTYIDHSKIKIPTIPGFIESDDITIEDGSIKIHFSKIQGADYFNLPIEWAFKKDVTPQNQVVTLHTELRDQDGTVLVVPPLNEEGVPENPTIAAYYDLPILRKGGPDKDSPYDPKGYLGGLREAGTTAVAKVDGADVIYIDHPDDVPFFFMISQTTINESLERQIHQVILKDTLPKYKAYNPETNKIEERIAHFDPDKNPGWKLSEDGTTVTYVKDTQGKTVVNPLPELLLQFPNGIMEQEIKNTVEAELIPHLKPDVEPTILLSDDVTIQLEESRNPVLPPGFTYFTKKAAQKFFYDFDEDKKGTFYWNLSLTPSSQKGDYYTNVVFTDKNLDQRLYYDSVKLPFTSHVATIRVFKTDGQTVEYKTVGGVYTFVDRDIDYIEIDMGGQKIRGHDYTVQIGTKLREPDKVHFSETDTLNNVFRNCAEMKAIRYDAVSGENRDIKWKTVCDSMHLKPLKLEMVPVKTQTYPSSGSGQNSVTIGDKGSYDLFVRRTLDGKIIENDTRNLNLQSFRMVDLLPIGMMLDEPEVELSKEFAASEGVNVEIIYNYFGSGRTAIVITANKLNPDVHKVARINTKIDLLMEPGAHTNDVYLSFDKENSQYSYGSTTEGNDLGDGHAYMHDAVSLSILKADYMQARKYIRRVEKNGDSYVATSEWSDRGVQTEAGGYLQYKLVVDNNTDSVKKGNTIYDVLPHPNDTVMQYNSQKERSARNSAFRNTLVGVDAPDGYTVSFAHQTAYNYGSMEAGEYLKGLSWTSTIDGATAFKVEPSNEDVTLSAREQLEIIVTMRAPEDGISNAGKRAFNSFVRWDSSLSNYFLEANIVYNEIPPPTGTIRLRKIADFDFSKTLPGAEFTLYDRYGKVFRKGITDDKGELVFENVPIDDYIIEETKAPDGFEAEYSFKIERSKWMANINLDGGVYTLNLGNIRNNAIFDAKAVIEKVDKNGKALAGVKFMLTTVNTVPRGEWTGVTDSEGKLEFTGLKQGQYRLTELSSVGHLMPNFSRTFYISKPDQVVSFAPGNKIVNDLASVKIFKIGLLSALDPELGLTAYSQGSGKLLDGPWTFVLKNTETNVESQFTITNDPKFSLSRLKTEVIYEIKEIKGPDNSIYKLNDNVYQFKITAQGQLVDANNKPFPTNEIYFPNEKKPMVGEVEVNKVDHAGNLLKGAEFTLFKFNEETKKYETTNISKETDEKGIAHFEDIPPGSYEIKETKVPEGYAGAEGSFKFIVEKVPLSSMAPPNYENQTDKVVHKFSYTAVNKKLDLEFVKRQPLAEMISEVEADELLKQNPGSVKHQRGDTPFYDVYIPIGGVTYDFYEVIKNADGEIEDKLIQKDMVTNAEGKLDFTSIQDFVLKPDGVYKLVETKTKDNSWVLNTKPVLIDMNEWIQNPTFTGLVSVSQNNYLKKGSVLLSKYDRYTQTRLPGVTFTLYRGRLEEVKLPDGSYDEEKVVSEKVTDLNGFANYRDLPLGHYVLVETQTLTEQGYYLFEGAFEFELTADETHFFASVYNMRDKDYFDLPIKKIWYGEAPDYGTEAEKGLLVHLYKDGERFETAVLKAENGWKHTFEKLLKKDDRGRDYKYTLEEVIPKGYDHSMIGIIANEGVITDLDGNELDPAEITLKNYKLKDLVVEKKWDDEDNIYELRPTSVEVQLQQGTLKDDGTYEYINLGEPITIEKDANGYWKYTFTGLRTHDENNKPFDYKVVETQVTGYESSYTPNDEGFVITNKLSETSLKVEKEWIDGDNYYKLRPDSITLQLQQNGEDFLDPVIVTVDSEGNWKYTFEKLPKVDEKGNVYTYTVVETKVPHYDEPTYEGPANGSILVKNCLPVVNLPVTKVWDDQDDKYELRPESITLQLQQNGEDFLDPVTVKPDKDGKWEYKFEKLPKVDEDGNAYTYTVVETKVPHYNDPVYTEENGAITVKNALTLVDVPIVKYWLDQGNKYGLRPESITLQLQQNGKNFLDPVTVKVNSEGNWKYTFEKLPKFDEEGNAYKYTALETRVPHYNDPVYGTEEGVFTITNALPTVDLPVTKIWEDQGDKYGLRPESIILQLQQNGSNFLDPVTVKADDDGNWKYIFEKLPKVDADGNAYTYTVVETKVPPYNDPVYGAEEGVITVTNTLPTVDLPVIKVWDDQDNKYGLRPESITLQLQQNGSNFLDPIAVKPDKDGNWKYTFEKLPKVDEKGNTYTYTVVETKVPHYNNPVYVEKDGSITITNTLPTVDLPVTKVWDDQDDRYGLRPESITLQLQQNGVNFLDPVTVKVDSEGNWKYTFEKLPKFDEEGNVYTYTVVETKVPHYNDPVYGAEEGVITVTNTLPIVDLPVIKVWDDQDNKYGLRPESITLQLQQNGVNFLDPVTVKVDSEGNWKYTFEKLPKVDADGNAYTYTVVETKVPHYNNPVYVEKDGSITITNTLPTVDLPVTKVWDDQEDKYGLRPESIILQLQQNGSNFLAPIAVKPDKDGNWKYTFEKLPKVDEKGNTYTYTVVETKVPHYNEPVYVENNGSITITNTLPVVDLPVTKVWDDQDNKYGLRPKSITLQLLQNGSNLLDPVTVKVDSEGNWKFTFEKLPKVDEKGNAYTYTVVETKVPHYNEPVYVENNGSITITNTLPVVDLPVTKVWDDQDNKYGLRPKSITLQLLQNGSNFLDPVTVKPDKDGNWKYSFEKLPKSDSDGKDYIYTVVESKVAHYGRGIQSTGNNGEFIITNPLPTTDILVEKVWVDQDDKYGLRPESITLQLQQNNVNFLDPVVVKADEEGHWEYAFEKLPLYDAEGGTYTYTVLEVKEAPYEDPEYTIGNGGVLIVTNKLSTVDIPVMKIWDDLGNKFDLRPESITLQLKQNDSKLLDPVTVKADDDGNWKYTFEKLPRVDAKGEEYRYAVEEEKVGAYQDPLYGRDLDTGIHLITNKLDLTDVKLSKVWKDMDDKYKLRPAIIKVQLKQNGKDLLDPVTLSKENAWTSIFNDLPKYDEEGKEYLYTLEEHPVPGYEVSYKEEVIENTLKLRDVLVKKQWEDEKDKHGLRPKTITLQLLRNGSVFLEPVKVKVEKGDSQEVKFSDLPLLDSRGNPFVYTVKELDVDKNYEVSYSKDGLTVTNKVIQPKKVQEKPKLPATGQKDGILPLLALGLLILGIYFRRSRYSY